MWHSLLTWTLLLVAPANSADPLSIGPEAMQGWVRTGEADAGVSTGVATGLVCEQKTELVFVEDQPSPTLVAIDRATGAEVRRLPLTAALPASPEYDCGMGTCYFQEVLHAAQGTHELTLTGHKSNYQGSWAPSGVLREQGGSATWRAICPGERPLAVCFTSRRTVQIELSGDPNQDPPRYGVDYWATVPGDESHATLHVSRGRVRLQGDLLEAKFTNGGFTYLLHAPLSGAEPRAALEVKRGNATVQSEPCLAFGLWPKHLAWVAKLKR